MQGRTWKNVGNGTAREIKVYLLGNGGLEEEVKSPHEEWRIKFSDSTFTFYKKGTLYSTPSNSNDPAVLKALTPSKTSPFSKPLEASFISKTQ